MPDVSNVSNVSVSNVDERHTPADDSGHQALAYLSRYLFWLVMAVLLGGFSLVI